MPLVFLEACQTATGREGVRIRRLRVLKVGVRLRGGDEPQRARRNGGAASSRHSTTRSLGARVGDAMLEGQRQLKDDESRGRVFGAGELRLQDWFVPVLFQEKDDPQLFAPRRRTADGGGYQGGLDNLRVVAPAAGDRLHRPQPRTARLAAAAAPARYAVVRGQGGEGKTALAAEFARWMVRSHRTRRAAFVSVETHSNAAAVSMRSVSSSSGRLLRREVRRSGEGHSGPLSGARRQATLLVVDNMESILLPPFVETPEALSEERARN